MVRLASADRVAPAGDRGPAGGADRLLQLHGRPVHDRRAPVHRRSPARRELPGLVRGLLLAFGCVGLQLALIVQSRGWLFTLPLVALAAIVVCPTAFASPSWRSFRSRARWRRCTACSTSSRLTTGAALDHAAARAGQAGLLICAAVFVLGTLLAWGDSLLRRPPPLAPAAPDGRHGAQRDRAGRGRGRRHDRAPTATRFRFVVTPVERVQPGRRPQLLLDNRTSATSAAAATTSGACPWMPSRPTRSAASARTTSPTTTSSIGGPTRSRAGPTASRCACWRTPALVGFALFVGFLVAALSRSPSEAGAAGTRWFAAVAGIALLPLVVWLIHGSVDWFWEMPALSGPALGFLGMAGALERRDRERGRRRRRGTPGSRSACRSRSRSVGRGVVWRCVAAVVVLGFPYLSVREVSLGLRHPGVGPGRGADRPATRGRR